MHKLTIEDDEGKTVVVPLIRDEITIGRQEGNTIRLTERNISRRHARLISQNGTLVVEDVGSYNGLKVNGARLTGPATLKDGDLLLVGDYRMTLRLERGATPPAPVVAPPQAGAPMGAGPIGSPALGPPGMSPAAPMPPTQTIPHGAPLPHAPAMPPPGAPPSPPVEAAIDGAPTLPVRTLADQGILPGPASAPAARLVAMSTDLSGSEFLLDRPSLVIGRTPENDVVLNHKSISRHHAKIIRDGDRYFVVDLESANGVRVNGTEHDRIELSNGDVVELGHVRLRFSTGPDGYDFDPGDLSAFGEPSSKSKYVFLGLAGLAIAGGAFFLLGGRKPEPRPAMTATAPATAPSVVPTPAPAAAPIPPPAAAESGEALLARAQAAMQAERWDEALEAATKAAASTPPPAAAAALRQTIEAEQQNARRFDVLKRAADGKNYDAVLTAFSAIPDGSLYKVKATPLHQEARTKAVAQHLAAAQRLRAQGGCDQAQKEAEIVLGLDTSNEAARGVIDACAKLAARAAAKPAARETKEPTPARPPARTVAATRPAGASPRVAVAAAAEPASPSSITLPVPSPAVAQRPAAPKAAPPAPTEEPASGGDADALIQEAQQAWLRQQHAAAISSARKALKARPGMARAYQIIAVCSCSLRDKDEATKAYEKLDDRNKQLVKSLCQKSGVVID